MALRHGCLPVKPTMWSDTKRFTARGLSRLTPIGGSSLKLNSSRTIHSPARAGAMSVHQVVAGVAQQ